MEAVSVEEVAEEGASRKPKPTLEMRKEYNVFPGLGFRLNLALRETALDFWRDPVSPVMPIEILLHDLGPIPTPPNTFFSHVGGICGCVRATLRAQRQLVGVSLPGAKIPDRKLLKATGFLASKIYRARVNRNLIDENMLGQDTKVA